MMRRSIKNRQAWKKQGLNNSMQIYRKLLHEEQILQRWGSHWADSMVPDLPISGQRELFAWRRETKRKNRKG